VGCPFHVPYEAPQGRRVNAIGAHFTHGPLAGELQFVSYASLPKSQAKQPRLVAEQAAKHGLTEDEVGKIDSEVFLAFLWTAAGRPANAGESWCRRRPLWYVLDNYSAHKSDRVRAEEPRLKAAGIHLFYLPAYSPELSRMEPVWQDVKYQGLPVRSFDRLGALKVAVDTALACKAIELRTARSETAQLLPLTP
jgi:hypothetical protein